MAAILKITISHYFFHPENDFSGFLDLKNLGRTRNSSLNDRSRWSYIGYKDVAAILDTIMNNTFLPLTWNVYPSFFNLL